MASERRVRVAVVGAGPAGFFTAETLLKHTSPLFEVDLIERLPTPYGLVRSGVAPDHQKLKSVTKAFEKIARLPRFRLLGNVTVGKRSQTSSLLEPGARLGWSRRCLASVSKGVAHVGQDEE